MRLRTEFCIRRERGHAKYELWKQVFFANMKKFAKMFNINKLG